MSAAPSIAASVAARLLNRARKAGDDYQNLLERYCFERFLYRLGESPLRDRFVLKGAMLLQLWSDHPYRATRDLDLLRRGQGSSEAIRSDLQSILEMPVVPDGVTFDSKGIQIEAIRADDEYVGTRARLLARCGSARLSLQIDMGLGDMIWPAPGLSHYPVMLDLPAPRVLVYPRETVVAEKFEAMVILGDRNSRIKDFFDLHFLAKHFEFDRATLFEAIRRTFVRRKTPIPQDDPIGLTEAYWENSSRPMQVRAFIKRSRISVAENAIADVSSTLIAFLSPILRDLRAGEKRPGTWPAGGPWS